jgi:membrane protein DedA with SNARE-associated domain
LTASVIAAHAHWAEWALFVWVLANQSGVPIPVVPALLGAGALAGSGGSLSVVVILGVSIAAALCADLIWYLLGRWRGSRAIDLLTRLVPKARPHVQCASHLLLTHARVFQLGARFLPEVNPIAVGLAGAAEMSVRRFLPGAAVSAAVWSGSWIGIGYLLTYGGAGLAQSVGIPLTFVVIATLVGWLLFRQAQRRILLHTVRQARTRGSSVPSRATLYLERGPEIHGDEAARDAPAAKENDHDAQSRTPLFLAPDPVDERRTDSTHCGRRVASARERARARDSAGVAGPFRRARAVDCGPADGRASDQRP